MSPHTTATALKKRPLKRLKQFRCEGYGDCDMVFSRSEHLARHIRKHTGEKPFKCESPGCNKTFSRYDNMRQHYVTHLKFKTKPNNNNSSSNDDENENEDEDDGGLTEIMTGRIKDSGENTGDLDRLTQDELDALDALNQFRHPPHATYKTSITTTTTPSS